MSLQSPPEDVLMMLDLLCEILSYPRFEFQELLALRLVCHRWNETICTLFAGHRRLMIGSFRPDTMLEESFFGALDLSSYLRIRINDTNQITPDLCDMLGRLFPNLTELIVNTRLSASSARALHTSAIDAHWHGQLDTYSLCLQDGDKITWQETDQCLKLILSMAPTLRRFDLYARGLRSFLPDEMLARLSMLEHLSFYEMNPFDGGIPVPGAALTLGQKGNDRRLTRLRLELSNNRHLHQWLWFDHSTESWPTLAKLTHLAVSLEPFQITAGDQQCCFDYSFHLEYTVLETICARCPLLEVLRLNGQPHYQMLHLNPTTLRHLSRLRSLRELSLCMMIIDFDPLEKMMQLATQSTSSSTGDQSPSEQQQRRYQCDTVRRLHLGHFRVDHKGVRLALPIYQKEGYLYSSSRYGPKFAQVVLANCFPCLERVTTVNMVHSWYPDPSQVPPEWHPWSERLNLPVMRTEMINSLRESLPAAYHPRPPPTIEMLPGQEHWFSGETW